MGLNCLVKTDLKNLKLFKKGKVRDIYEIDGNLLIISTDRISCFDVILPSPIPSKGMVLTELSAFWFKFTENIIKNHFITIDVDKFPNDILKYRNIVKERAMLVKKLHPLPVECVVRGYLSGSGWKEYKKKTSVCGIKLLPGIRESDKLPEIIFTPATKATSGHDINISEKDMYNLIGRDVGDIVKEKSIAIYKKASEYALKMGIIIADTKFEFGISDGEVILIDEILTPDSSRFWPKEWYSPGGPQESFDKQFVRDYLETLNWNKRLPAPELPQDVIQKTSEKYLQVCKMIKGEVYD